MTEKTSVADSHRNDRCLSGNDIAVIKKSDQEQLRFREYVRGRRDFTADEQATLDIDSVEAFQDIWGVIVESKTAMEERRKRGSKRVGQCTLDFFAAASDILNYIGPLLNLIKDIGAPYGGMAIGTMSFLFAIAKNKVNIENSISDTMEQIRDRVVGLSVYQHIFNDDHVLDHQIQSHIVAAYDSFMGFCIAATKYYTQRGFKRFLRAVIGASITLDEYALQVQKAIVKVRETGEETLNKNVGLMKGKIQFLEARLKHIQEALARDRLSVLRGLLGLPVYEAKKNYELLLQYEEDHEYLTSNGNKKLETMGMARIEELQKDQRWMDWRTSPKSSLLFLAGYNHDVGFGQCWLSPAAIHLVKTMYNKPPSDAGVFAFYILGLRSKQQKDEHLTEVLAHVLIQLLSQQLWALQDGDISDDLQAAFERYATIVATATEDPKNTFRKPQNMEIVQTAALKVFNLFYHKNPEKQKTVWIIIDRLDRVKEPPGRLLEVLEYLVANAKVKVKILAVVNGWDWPDLRDVVRSLAEKRDEGVIVYEVEQTRR